MHKLFGTVKQAEFDQFHAQIQPLEYQWYLRG
jgi:glutamine synthetase